MSQFGINIYIANNVGADPLASADLATLKNYGIQAIPGQDSVGLANINDPTIVVILRWDFQLPTFSRER
jgi:hypothetical protein